MTEENNATPNVDHGDSFNRASGSSPPGLPSVAEMWRLLQYGINEYANRRAGMGFEAAALYAHRIIPIVHIAGELISETEEWTGGKFGDVSLDTALQVAAQIVLAGEGGAV